MTRQVILYGLVGGILITILKWAEFRFVVVEHSIEIYGGLIAAVFAALGIWLGLRLTRTKVKTDVEPAVVASLISSQVPKTAASFVPDDERRDSLGITRREMEILALIAEGLSNREIAGKLFVSENTVKTHCSRAFDKLGAKRRTQAVQRSKEFGLLP